MRALFSATIFVGSALLFLVQPMVGKMVLPRFGGAPAVWSTCLVFFQAALLAGYAYAHLATSRLGVRRQARLHAALMLLALAAIPIGLPDRAPPPGDASPVPELLGLLATTVGLPFFLVSAGAPLLQRWFSVTDDPAARDPYFLYAASNAGSLLALLAYPLLIEPRLPLREQARCWSAGYGLLVALIVACAATVRRSARSSAGEGPEIAEDSPVGLWTRARWVALSAVPSSLLLGVTTYLTTDISPIPLMWVLPLALYLGTFIVAFSAAGASARRLSGRAMPAAVLALSFLMLAKPVEAPSLIIPAHLLTFAVAALACHSELAALRPPAGRLTEFYLWVSVGGFLGGVFNTFVAPTIFPTVVEYPLAFVAACLLGPRFLGPDGPSRLRWTDLAMPAALGALAAAFLSGRGGPPSPWRWGILLSACAIAMGRPTRLGMSLGACWLVALLHSDPRFHVLHRERNFFGALRVDSDSTGRWHSLSHGTTRHGAQYLGSDPRQRLLPLLYYYPTGPIGPVFDLIEARRPRSRIAVIGLGVGSLAGYGNPEQEYTFFEIDPAVVRIARDPRFFTYLRDSPARCRVVIGDARLSLAREPDGAYDLLVVDAFSGDAVPVHLLTREAIRLDFSRLAPDGLLALHLSNSYLDLIPVAASLARDSGLVAMARVEDFVSPEEQKRGKIPSQWVVMARKTSDLRPLSAFPGWKPLLARPESRAWSDDYSDVLGALRWR